jgi:hypothetical protein
MFENQMKKKRPARKGNQRRASQVVGELDRHLDLVRLALHPVGDEGHRPDRQPARQDQIEDRLVDAEIDPGDLNLDPWVELELVLGLKLVVLALAAEDQQHDDEDPEVDPEGEKRLRLGTHERASSG